MHCTSSDMLFPFPTFIQITLISFLLFSSTTFFDRLQRGLVSEIVNVDLSNSAWTLASLPVHSGGHRIRSAVQLASSAFLASAAAYSDFIYQTLPERLSGVQCTFQDDAINIWSQSHELHPLKELGHFDRYLGLPL